MPKIIDNLRETLLRETEAMLLDAGYRGFTMRGLARRCGIASGTIFNYFSSKDMLIASVLAAEWRDVMEAAQRSGCGAADVLSGLGALYDGISGFAGKYAPVWKSYNGNIFGPQGEHHLMLRRQIASSIRSVLASFDVPLGDPELRIYAETLLAAALQPDIQREDFLRFSGCLMKGEA